jgi:glycosyltransferase involved in cell wall biosynthesis
MYKIGLDISALDLKFKSHAQRGIGRYVSELKKYFDSHTGAGMDIGTFDHREFRDSGILSKIIDKLPAGRQTIRQQLLYPMHLGGTKKRFDALHFPAHMDAPSWSINNYILTVLDLIPLVMSEMYKAVQNNFRFNFARWLEMKAIKNASLILAISQNTADDVHKILKIPYEKIIVTPLGVDPRFFVEISPEEKDHLKEKYKIPAGRQIVLSVGGIDPRKNYISLIESFSRLLKIFAEKQYKPPVLLIVGSIKNDREYPRLTSMIESAGIGDFVVETGYADDLDLPGLYAISDVLFFPSLYEGFGLTPLEAMAAGTTVVCSGTSCMPEVLGEAAIFADTEDYDQCAAKLCDVLSMEKTKNKLRAAGLKRASMYTWQKTGELTMNAYEKLISEKYAKVSHRR